MNSNTKKLHKAVINDIISWLVVNNGHDQSIEKIAEISGYSKGHIQRVFYKYHNITLGSFCRKLRLSRIIKDLKKWEHSLVEISVMHNFPSQQSFTHYFKRETGCTPGGCRKNAQCYACSESRREYLTEYQAKSDAPLKIM